MGRQSAHTGSPRRGARRLGDEAALGDPLQHPGEQVVLAREDAQAQGLLVVAGQDGDGGLRDDGTGVGAAIDQMHGAAGDPHAVLEGLTLRVDAREGRQERRVDVDDVHREGVEHHVREQAHEPCQDDPFGPVGAQGLHHGRVEGATALVMRVIDDDGRNAGGARPVDRPGAGDVRDDDGDACVELARGDGVDDGLQVRPAPGRQHAEDDHEGHSTRSSKGRSLSTRTMVPSAMGLSPSPRSTSVARASSGGGTTMTNPTPALNARRISCSSMPALR
jgi:hypothetical protein